MPVISSNYYACHPTEKHYGLLQRALWQKCGVHKNSRVKSSPLVRLLQCLSRCCTQHHVQLCRDKNVWVIIQLLSRNFCKIASVFTQADVPNASVDPARGRDLSAVGSSSVWALHLPDQVHIKISHIWLQILSELSKHC